MHLTYTKTAKIESKKYLFYKCPYQGDHLQGLSKACNIEISIYNGREVLHGKMDEKMARFSRSAAILHFGESTFIEPQQKLINSIPS